MLDARVHIFLIDLLDPGAVISKDVGVVDAREETGLLEDLFEPVAALREVVSGVSC